MVFSSQTGATVTFYGQINLTYQGADDSVETYDNFIDNNNSVSRFGIWIDTPMGENKFRFNFETGLGLKNTADTSQMEDLEWFDWQKSDIRKFEGVFSGKYGAIWFGQGSMATGNVAEIDKSGTTVVGYANVADMAGSFQFRDGNMLTGITVGNVFNDFDGSRRFRIRYDTPVYSGFSASAAYGKNVLAENDNADYYDAALRYGFKNDTIALDAAIGYNWAYDNGTTSEQLMGSVSAIHVPTGLNLTLAAGDNQMDEGRFFYGKLGWYADLISYGSTALSVDYYDGSDFEFSGSKSNSWGLQAVQYFDELKLEAYLGYREYSYDDVPGSDFENLNVVLAGARWKF